MIDLLTEPGLGIRINEELVRKCAEEHKDFSWRNPGQSDFIHSTHDKFINIFCSQSSEEQTEVSRTVSPLNTFFDHLNFCRHPGVVIVCLVVAFQSGSVIEGPIYADVLTLRRRRCSARLVFSLRRLLRACTT